MKKLTTLTLLCTLLFGMLFSACSSDETMLFGNVHGLVTDSQGNPIQAVSVTLNPVGKTTTTGSDGRYEFNDLKPGQFTIQFVKTGYQSNVKNIDVVADKSAQGDIILAEGDGNLQVNKTELNFGKSNTMLPFEIKNSGTTDIEWSISAKCDWISEVKATSGITKPNRSSSVTVTIDRSKLKKGKTESYAIVITSNSGSATVNVVATGNDGTDPKDPEVPGNLTAGLLAYYTFDNANAEDIHTNNVDGHFPNSATFNTDTPNGEGKSVFLNGIKGEYLNIPNNLFLDKENYSVSIWVKDINSGVIFSSVANGRLVEDSPRLMAEENGKLSFRTGSGNDGVCYYDYKYTPNLQNNKWHLLTITVAPSDKYNTAETKLYIDGNLIDTAITDLFNYSSAPKATKIQFGGNSGGKMEYSPSMSMDNIRFYNRTLPQADVKAIYTAEK